MDIVWLGERDCHDRALVGGKAANLSRLAATFRVPPGFCLTTKALRATLATGQLGENPLSALQPLPNALDSQLAVAYQRLAQRCQQAEPQVAVRSSADAEDSADSSFAGQHESYLNVSGSGSVAAAVRRCWASAHSAHALAYRRHQGLEAAETRLAVLVQQLVVADVSAVLFSANPITGRRDEIVINASWGLGESIVGGTVTPDTYRVRKADLALIARQITEKTRMTVAIPGGTQEVDVPRFLRTQPALTDEQITEMATLALSLEATMGWPVDVECAFHAQQLYLLQCRPITTL